MIVSNKENTYGVLFVNFIYVIEFQFSYGYMLRFLIFCLINSMRCACCVLIFDIFPCSIDYVGSTVFL